MMIRSSETTSLVLDQVTPDEAPSDDRGILVDGDGSESSQSGLSRSPPVVPFPRSSRPRPRLRTTSSRPSSTPSSCSGSTTTVLVQRPHVVLRTRHSSLPAASMNRVSVASSFASVEEQDEQGETDNDGPRSSCPSSRAARRSSLSPSSGVVCLPSIASTLDRGPTPPSAKNDARPRATTDDRRLTVEERMKRRDKRWRIAQELRDTERAYVRVLEEIDADYYRPLLEALDPVDPLVRRASNRFSAVATSPNASPRTSSYHRVEPNSSPPPPPPPEAPSSTPLPNAVPPCESRPPILSRREINEVFSNFVDVLNLSHVMLVTLEQEIPDHINDDNDNNSFPDDDDETRSSDPAAPATRRVRQQQEPRSGCSSIAAPARLGRALLPIVPFLKQYSLFVANFSGSLARLSALERTRDSPLQQQQPQSATASSSSSSSSRERWKRFIDDKKKGHKIGLGGMLLNVVQRVPRYRLLLAELVRMTDRDHPDLDDLCTAYELVDSVATHLDSQIESHVHDLAILDLQRTFTNLVDEQDEIGKETRDRGTGRLLVAPGRRWLKRGDLRTIDRRTGQATTVKSFFLFNDIFVHAVPSATTDQTTTTTYRLVDRFELEDVTVVASDTMTGGGGDDSSRYGFDVLTTRKSFAVYADSLESKLEWLEAIRDAKAALMSDRRTLQRATVSDAVTATVDPSTTTAMSTAREVRSDEDENEDVATRSALAPPVRPIDDLDLSTPRSSLAVDPIEIVDGVGRKKKNVPGSERPLSSPPLLREEEGPLSSSSSSRQDETRHRRVRRPSSRRWSEFGGHAADFAAQAFASAFNDTTSSSSTTAALGRPFSSSISSSRNVAREGGGGGGQEYKVIEAYHAPVWVPDSRCDKCMRCGSQFGVFRRKHHCRLCGGVVCWACSTRYFIIPSFLLSNANTAVATVVSPDATATAATIRATTLIKEKRGRDPRLELELASKGSVDDRLARSCDACYESVFGNPPPASRLFLKTSEPVTTLPGRRLRRQVEEEEEEGTTKDHATLHRLSRRIVDPRRMPLFDNDDDDLFLTDNTLGGGGGGGGRTATMSSSRAVTSGDPNVTLTTTASEKVIPSSSSSSSSSSSHRHDSLRSNDERTTAAARALEKLLTKQIH